MKRYQKFLKAAERKNVPESISNPPFCRWIWAQGIDLPHPAALAPVFFASVFGVTVAFLTTMVALGWDYFTQPLAYLWVTPWFVIKSAVFFFVMSAAAAYTTHLRWNRLYNLPRWRDL